MIEQGKEIRLENVLFLRKRIPQNKLNEEIQNIGLYLNNNSLKRAGPVVTATFSSEIEDEQQVFDMEILIPVNRMFESTGEYGFKKVFHLVNAVYAQHKGNPSLLQNTYNQIISYIQENKLQQITAAYNVNLNELQPGQSIDDLKVDIYIGVNPSIL